MSELQNIIIVGASSAGHALANTLVPNVPATHRILLIDAQAFSYFPIASLRAAVVPGWENKMTGPLNTEAVFGKSSPHKVIAPNRVVELKKNSVVLEREFEGKREIPFDKCVLAVGSSQPYPMKGNPADSLEAVRENLKRMQADVGKAKKVVVIGGGPVGLEYAGEVRAQYPKTPITILHSLSRPLNPTDPSKAAKANTEGSSRGWQAPASSSKLSTQLEDYLKKLNIDFVGNAKVPIPDPSTPKQGNEWNGSAGLQDGLKIITLPDGRVIEGDYFFVGVGNKSNAGFVEKADSGAVVNGLIHVDKYLKVQSSNPDSPLTANYFAIGDCCDTPGWKTMQGATADVAAVAPNVIADIKRRPLKPYKRTVVHGLVIPLGPEKGLGYMTLPVIGDMSLPGFAIKGAKAEKLFVDQYFADRFKGTVKVGVNAGA